MIITVFPSQYSFLNLICDLQRVSLFVNDSRCQKITKGVNHTSSVDNSEWNDPPSLTSNDQPREFHTQSPTNCSPFLSFQNRRFKKDLCSVLCRSVKKRPADGILMRKMSFPRFRHFGTQQTKHFWISKQSFESQQHEGASVALWRPLLLQSAKPGNVSST